MKITRTKESSNIAFTNLTQLLKNIPINNITIDRRNNTVFKKFDEYHQKHPTIIKILSVNCDLKYFFIENKI